MFIDAYIIFIYNYNYKTVILLGNCQIDSLSKMLLESTSFLKWCCFERVNASSGRPPFLPRLAHPSSLFFVPFRSPSRRRRLSSACHEHCYCGINFRLRFQLSGLPAGVKFSPTSARTMKIRNKVETKRITASLWEKECTLCILAGSSCGIFSRNWQ